MLAPSRTSVPGYVHELVLELNCGDIELTRAGALLLVYTIKYQFALRVSYAGIIPI